MTEDPRAELARRIETIEEAYEFMLAYAAQGHEDEVDGESGIREFLTRMEGALDGLGALAAATTAAGGDGARAAWGDFVPVVDQDAGRARAAVRVALVQPSIGSQLVDNLNASSHLRTLLTDLFFIDEALKG